MRHRIAYVLEILSERLDMLAHRIRYGRMVPESDPAALRHFTGHLTFGDYPDAKSVARAVYFATLSDEEFDLELEVTEAMIRRMSHKEQEKMQA